jgi:hypothetical protein
LLSDAQSRVLETFILLENQIPKNFFEASKDLQPYAKPATLQKLVDMKYLEPKNVKNVYGEKITLYRYTGRRYTDRYDFSPKLNEPLM